MSEKRKFSLICLSAVVLVKGVESVKKISTRINAFVLKTMLESELNSQLGKALETFHIWIWSTLRANNFIA
jgi:hypothetical protein